MSWFTPRFALCAPVDLTGHTTLAAFRRGEAETVTPADWYPSVQACLNGLGSSSANSLRADLNAGAGDAIWQVRIVADDRVLLWNSDYAFEVNNTTPSLGILDGSTSSAYALNGVVGHGVVGTKRWRREAMVTAETHGISEIGGGFAEYAVPVQDGAAPLGPLYYLRERGAVGGADDTYDATCIEALDHVAASDTSIRWYSDARGHTVVTWLAASALDEIEWPTDGSVWGDPWLGNLLGFVGSETSTLDGSLRVLRSTRPAWVALVPSEAALDDYPQVEQMAEGGRLADGDLVARRSAEYYTRTLRFWVDGPGRRVAYADLLDLFAGDKEGRGFLPAAPPGGPIELWRDWPWDMRRHRSSIAVSIDRPAHSLTHTAHRHPCRGRLRCARSLDGGTAELRPLGVAQRYVEQTWSLQERPDEQ